MGGDNTKGVPIARAEIHDHAVQVIKPTGLTLVGENRAIAELLALLVPLINQMLIGYGYNYSRSLFPFIESDRGRQGRYRLASPRRHFKQAPAVMGKPGVNGLILIVSQINSCRQRRYNSTEHRANAAYQASLLRFWLRIRPVVRAQL